MINVNHIVANWKIQVKPACISSADSTAPRSRRAQHTSAVSRPSPEEKVPTAAVPHRAAQKRPTVSVANDAQGDSVFFTKHVSDI